MKKLIFLLMAIVVIGNTTFAQGKADKKAKPVTEKAASTKGDKKDGKKEGKKEDAGKTGGKMKKDGTPDMRYKENKEKKAGPMKKDGTPDMRYKANKDAAKKKGDKK